MMIDVYILTLKRKDDLRLRNLVDQLEAVGGVKVRIVPGVVGADLTASEYFKKMIVTQARYKGLLSPGAMGCALGHARVLRRIARSDADIAMVLEDDVILQHFSENIVAQLHTIFAQFKPDLVHLGREKSPGIRRHLFGKAVDERSKIFELDKSSLQFLYGTYAYAISRLSSRAISTALSKCVFRIDDFAVISDLLPKGRVYAWPIAGHPEDFSRSLIHEERQLILGEKTNGATPSLISRVMMEVIGSLSYRVGKMSTACRRKASGYHSLLSEI